MDLTEDHRFKVPVVRRPDYTLYLEQANAKLTFIHCDVHVRWTPNVKKRLEDDWALLLSLHGGPLYALHDPEDRKHEKFLAMFGFHYVTRYRDRSTGRMTHIYKTK